MRIPALQKVQLHWREDGNADGLPVIFANSPGTEGAWGTVWASDRITRRERSIITLALLAATGNFEEIPMHIRATANTGTSEEDVVEAFQHLAIHAGVPRANHALKIPKKTFEDRKTP